MPERTGDAPRVWRLSRFSDGMVCLAVGDDDKSSALERVDVVEALPLSGFTWPVHDVAAPTEGDGK